MRINIGCNTHGEQTFSVKISQTDVGVQKFRVTQIGMKSATKFAKLRLKDGRLLLRSGQNFRFEKLYWRGQKNLFDGNLRLCSNLQIPSTLKILNQDSAESKLMNPTAF